MAVNVINFTTGPSTLPDTGALSYNGCVFSPLFETKVSGEIVKDNANRTVKQIVYTLMVDGYATMPTGAVSINGVTSTLRDLLTKQGGALVYRGRGIDLIINPQGDGGKRDVAWGPIPEVIEFQPLGGGKSAKVLWRVKVAVTEVARAAGFRTDPRGRIVAGIALQFNYDTSVEYGEDGYSTLVIRGTLEIPMTRPTQNTRTLSYTVDGYRHYIENQIGSGIDLTRFRITHRKFDVSRDKRTLEWEFTAEEKPYMDMPPDCTIARGSYSVRPAKAGMGLALWLCTLRATYVVRADKPRRVAWFAFLALLRLRMSQSNLGVIPAIQNGDQNPPVRDGNQNPPVRGNPPPGLPPAGARLENNLRGQNRIASESRNAWLINFSFDEGLYLDSKSITFSATWRMVTMFSHILLASGLWKKMPETDEQGRNVWAISMRDVSGAQSWLPNRVDPRLDVIVDFGGP